MSSKSGMVLLKKELKNEKCPQKALRSFSRSDPITTFIRIIRATEGRQKGLTLALGLYDFDYAKDVFTYSFSDLLVFFWVLFTLEQICGNSMDNFEKFYTNNCGNGV